MKIDGFGSIGSTNNTGKRKNVSQSGNFADLLAAAETDETAQAAHTSETNAPAALSNFLALQEVPAEYVERKKLMQQGNNMLDTLENLRRQLLSGRVAYTTLKDIEREVELKKQEVNDPQLKAIIADIELRAAVEMAKLQYADEHTPVFKD